MTERPDPEAPAPETPDPRHGGGAGGASGGRRALWVLVAVVAGTAAGLAGVYGIGGGGRNAAPPAATTAAPALSAVSGVSSSQASGVTSGSSPLSGVAGQCEKAGAAARALVPLATGELAAFAPTLIPVRVPDLGFTAPDGAAARLSATGGPGLRLVNIWATWCVPCRTEMPALDRLQGERGGPDFNVVAVNIDTRDAEKPKRFFEETGIRNLALYVDPKAQAFQDLRAVGRGFGLPTTLLIDGENCEIGHISGPAEWAGPAALKLIDAARAAYAAP